MIRTLVSLGTAWRAIIAALAMFLMTAVPALAQTTTATTTPGVPSTGLGGDPLSLAVALLALGATAVTLGILAIRQRTSTSR